MASTFTNVQAFPLVGILDVLYVAADTSRAYRWTGSAYTEVSADPARLAVAALPAASSTNARYVVTDATSTTFGAAVTGGGSNTVPVYSDGTNWRIG